MTTFFVILLILLIISLILLIVKSIDNFIDDKEYDSLQDE